MKISVRSLNGDGVDIEIDAQASVLQLKAGIQDALRIPVNEQRLVYAGVQLEEVVSPSWRQRRASSSALSAALGLSGLPDGALLTLEHHGIQKGSVVNVVRKAIVGSAASAFEEVPTRPVSSAAAAAMPVNESTDPRALPLPTQLMDITQRKAEPTSWPDANVSPRAAPMDGSPAALRPHLNSLSDLDLLMLLRPILRQRPVLRAALLAEDLPVSQPTAVPPTPGVPLPQASPQIRRGDVVSVWSNSAQRWCQGEVIQIAEADTGPVPKGSIQVDFELGKKWIAPTDFGRTVRLS